MFTFIPRDWASPNHTSTYTFISLRVFSLSLQFCRWDLSPGTEILGPFLLKTYWGSGGLDPTLWGRDQAWNADVKYLSTLLNSWVRFLRSWVPLLSSWGWMLIACILLPRLQFWYMESLRSGIGISSLVLRFWDLRLRWWVMGWDHASYYRDLKFLRWGLEPALDQVSWAKYKRV